MELTKPKFRGVLHQVAFYVSLITGPVLVLIARAGNHLAAAIYSVAMSALFGVSALYHKPSWGPKVRRWLGRIDHTMIMVFTAATFTPIALALDSDWSRIVLVIAWSAALLGMLLWLLPLNMPKSVAVIPFLALGWFGVSLFPASFSQIGLAPPLLLLVGGLLYTIGAVAYARRSPNPRPAVFGYHEVFHAFVVAAAYVHYGAIALTVA
ncbi:MAG: hemolysin III family protein [Actinomycetota bacterium]|nr:hemolysin III family protein [Actinomycetota bacterium]